jgi:NAD(P)H-flavin reductase
MPLRKIVGGSMNDAYLECGHTVKVHAYWAERSFCHVCLREGQKAWDAAHRGRDIVTTGSIEWRVADLEAQIEQLTEERDLLQAKLDARKVGE